MRVRYLLIVLMTIYVGHALWQKEQERIRDNLSPIASSSRTRHMRSVKVRRIKPVEAATTNASNVSDYLQALQQDNFCEVYGQDVFAGNHLALFFKALGFGEDFRYAELTQDENPWSQDPSQVTYNSPIARFIQALRLSGDLEGSPKLPVVDAPRAHRALTELAQQDSNNAAFLYFRLGIESDLEFPLEERIQTGRALLRTRAFDSLHMDLIREVQTRMRENASKAFAGVSFLNRIAIPSHRHARSAVLELDGQISGLGEHLAQLMTTPYLNSPSPMIEMGLLAAEYSIGRSFAPWLNIPTLKEAEERKISPRSFDFSDVILDKEKCDESYHEQVRAAVARW